MMQMLYENLFEQRKDASTFPFGAQFEKLECLLEVVFLKVTCCYQSAHWL